MASSKSPFVHGSDSFSHNESISSLNKSKAEVLSIAVTPFCLIYGQKDYIAERVLMARNNSSKTFNFKCEKDTLKRGEEKWMKKENCTMVEKKNAHRKVYSDSELHVAHNDRSDFGA